MTIETTTTRLLLGLFVGATLLGGCATTQPPTDKMESSAASIRGAQEAGAQNVPRAALYLQLANEQSAKAKQLISSGGHDNMKAAANLLMRASADGDLAIALADDDKDRLAAEAAVAQIHTFEQQTQ
jgi:outer membrane murein-binding lipoprotein Lpp